MNGLREGRGIAALSNGSRYSGKKMQRLSLFPCFYCDYLRHKYMNNALHYVHYFRKTFNDGLLYIAAMVITIELVACNLHFFHSLSIFFPD